MVLAPGWNVLTTDPQEVIQHFLNRLNYPIKPRTVRQFLKTPYQIQTNTHFNTLQLFPIQTAKIYDIDSAMLTLHDDVTPSIVELCREWQRIKIWFVLYVRSESSNHLDDPLKTFTGHIPVTHLIFLHLQPEVAADRSTPHYSGLSRLSERLFEANA